MADDREGNIGFTGDAEFNARTRRNGTERTTRSGRPLNDDEPGGFVPYSAFCAAIRTKVMTFESLNRAFSERDDALLKLPSWRIVDDDRPSGVVLLAVEGWPGEHYVTAGSYAGGKWWQVGGSDPIASKVTHWMPLPEPPK